MRPSPIFEGAAGLGGLGHALSSYEAVSGLGDYIAMNGLGDYFTTSSQLRGLGATVSGGGAVYIDPNCPMVTSDAGPPGVPIYQTPAYNKLLCTTTDAEAAVCNNSRDPYSCYFAKKYNKSFKNRVPAAAVGAWRAWGVSPSGEPLIPGTTGPAQIAANMEDDNTMLYVGLAAGAIVLVGAAVWWKKRHKAAA